MARRLLNHLAQRALEEAPARNSRAINVLLVSGEQCLPRLQREASVNSHDFGTERKRANLDSGKKPGSPDPRPAHVRNFLDCVKSRRQPVLNLEVGHHVSTVAHLGNLAYRTGRKLTWDAVKERIVNDPEADGLLGVRYRKPWSLPYARRG